MTSELKGKVALVTGASRGLGAGIARTLAERGAKVGINYCGSPEKAQRLASEIKSAGGEAVALRADVRDEAEVAKLVADVEARYGAIDILVCNATGPQPMIKLDELTWQDCLNQLEFFVKSPVLLVRMVLPKMKARRSGRIIQIGSEVVERGVPELSDHVCAKGAQLELTRSWGAEPAA